MERCYIVSNPKKIDTTQTGILEMLRSTKHNLPFLVVRSIFLGQNK